jgi:hydroxymethylbilane synthase
MREVFTIGTRGSKLALWQAEFVRARLAQEHPQVTVNLEIIKTSGDKIQNVSLTEIGGRGVFTKELEVALLENKIDLAVHSLKDLPTILPDNLHLAAVLPREDVRDALILPKDLEIESPSLHNLPENAVVGTSSLRRAAQLKNLRPDLQIKDIRGNVDTRLGKLDGGDYDAILLAVAGLKRLGLTERISAVLEIEEMLPQVGQGALAIEARKNDAATSQLVSVLNDAETFACVTAERAFLRGLGGGCQFPIASYARFDNNSILINGLVAAPDGSTIIKDSLQRETVNPIELGEALAEKLLGRGARNLLNLNH